MIHWGGWESGILLPGVPPPLSPPSSPLFLAHDPLTNFFQRAVQRQVAPVTRKGDPIWAVKHLQLSLPTACGANSSPTLDGPVPWLCLQKVLSLPNTWLSCSKKHWPKQHSPVIHNLRLVTLKQLLYRKMRHRWQRWERGELRPREEARFVQSHTA